MHSSQKKVYLFYIKAYYLFVLRSRVIDLLFRHSLDTFEFNFKQNVHFGQQVHSTHLMTSVVQPGPGGFIEPLPFGGRRRIDKIVYKGSTEDIAGYCFVSALTNLTDHLPVCMTLKSKLS